MFAHAPISRVKWTLLIGLDKEVEAIVVNHPYPTFNLFEFFVTILVLWKLSCSALSPTNQLPFRFLRVKVLVITLSNTCSVTVLGSWQVHREADKS